MSKYEVDLDMLREANSIYGSRMTFDCEHAIVRADGRVECERRHFLGQARDGTASLSAVQRGTRFEVCQDCVEWKSGEDRY